MMDKYLITFLLAIFSVSQGFAAEKQNPVNVMSYNIRYANPDDGNNQWKFRKGYAVSLIRFYEIDILGAQEVLCSQLHDLEKGLAGYAYIGIAREDGKNKGEYNPIFYKKDRFELLDSGTFWLAEDINAVGKKGWDGACERIATWGIFEDKQNGKRFLFLNTHLDHMGTVARREGAKLLLRQIDKLAGAYPVVVTGDFNATANQEPIQILTQTTDKLHLTNSRTVAVLKYGPEWTWHDFGRLPANQRELIDYIFVKGDIHVLRHGVLSESDNGLYPSDHNPVAATILLR